MKKILAICILCLSSAALMAKKETPKFDPNFDKGTDRYSCEKNCQERNRWTGWFHTGKYSKDCEDTCKHVHEEDAKTAKK